MFLAESVDGRVNLLELAARGVRHNARPGFVGFAEGQGVGMARPAIAAQRFVGDFGDVRPTHDHGDAGGAQGVGDAVGFGDHAGHGADAHEPDASLRANWTSSASVMGCALPSISSTS